MLSLFIWSLACWRISYLLVNEDGPNDLIKRFRAWTMQSTWSPLGCFYCTSFWVGLVIALISKNDWFIGIALSAAAIFIDMAHTAGEE